MHHIAPNVITQTDGCGLLNHVLGIDWLGEFIAIWQGFPFANIHFCLNLIAKDFLHQVPKFTNSPKLKRQLSAWFYVQSTCTLFPFFTFLCTE